METTLNAIRQHGPCQEGWKKLLVHLGKSGPDDEPLPILTILDSNGLDDALWCLRAVKGHDREIRLFAVWCVREVQHLLRDQLSVAALDAAEAYANGEATISELNAALDAAWDAEMAAALDAALDAEMAAARGAAWDAEMAAARGAALDAAWGAAWDAARAAARGAALDAAVDAARAAAWDAAGSAAWAAGSAWDAAGSAAWAAGSAWDAAGSVLNAARDAQERRLREVIRLTNELSHHS